MDLRRITGSGTGESARTGVTGSVSSTVTFTGVTAGSACVRLAGGMGSCLRRTCGCAGEA